MEQRKIKGVLRTAKLTITKKGAAQEYKIKFSLKIPNNSALLFYISDFLSSVHLLEYIFPLISAFWKKKTQYFQHALQIKKTKFSINQVILFL